MSSNLNPDQILKELSPKNQEIILRHLKHNSTIQKWNLIIEHLIKQFHEKKFTKINNTISSKNQDKQSDLCYQYLLWNESENNGNLEDFPCQFQGMLEHKFFQEVQLRTPLDLKVYCNFSDRSFCAKEKDEWSHFEEKDWQLEQTPHLTSNDIEVLQKFKDRFTEFLLELPGLCIKPSDLNGFVQNRIKRMDKAPGLKSFPRDDKEGDNGNNKKIQE